MRIYKNSGFQNRVLNVSGINKDSNKNNLTHKNKQKKKKATISVSPLGRANDFIEALIKQRENIIESKNKLITRTLEKGVSIESLKSQIEDYEKQLKNIDTQLSQIMTEL